MRIISICVLFLLFSVMAVAQQGDSATKNNIRFHSYNQGGVLIGQSEQKGLLQTVNGVSVGKYFAGAGLGLDYYFERTVPVFLELRRNFCEKEKTPFVYADGGYHYVWLKEEKPFESEEESGWFYEAGVGYQFPLHVGVDFVLSAGYSYKGYSKMVNTMPWVSVWPAPKEAFQRYDYELRRIAVKLGLRF